MQSIAWYVNRLRTMSSAEIWWRINALVDTVTERVRVTRGTVPGPTFQPGFDQQGSFTPTFRLVDVPIGTWNKTSATEQETKWCKQLTDKADKILEHRLSFFDLEDQFLGSPINWHIDHSAKIQGPLDHIMSVNYRDFKKFGDCKLVWEPNRHHQLVVLGRAYRATGDKKYAQAVVDHIQSWLDNNPYGKGMNWRSPLELGIRLINWVWAIDYIIESDLFAGSVKERIIESIYLHLRDISRKFSQGTSANNHLVGEAAGVFIAASYFNIFVESRTWIESSQKIIEREIQAQTYKDGCTREHALGYQFFVFQFYLFSGLVARHSNRPFSSSYWSTLETIALFIAKLAEGGTELPMFGDRDDGYVLDLGNAVHDINTLMDIGSLMFDHPIFASLRQENSETTFWLTNEQEKQSFTSTYPLNTPTTNDKQNITSFHFEESNYFLLQYGNIDAGNKVSLLIDSAELGFTNIAAHGHADALSFAMRLNDIDLFVDTGTYDYFSYPEWRNYFRKTCAHNTVEVDGQDQSVMQGPFMWAQHANTTCIEWSPNEVGGTFMGRHDGYKRFDDPVTHLRKLNLDGVQQSLQIVDTIKAKAPHKIAIYFHLSEYCEVIHVEDNVCTINMPSGEVHLTIDKDLDIQTVVGNTAQLEPGPGWLSRGYHQKIPVTTIIARGQFAGNHEFSCLLEW